jgi:hypothetical protein
MSKEPNKAEASLPENTETLPAKKKKAETISG